jgi:HEAT repeat protein
MIQTELSLVTVVLTGFGLWVLGLYLLSLVRGLRWRRNQRAAEARLPLIREALVDYLSGNEDRTRLRQFVQENREYAGAALMSFQGAVAGGARDRLCDLALELALVHDWCQNTRSRSVIQRREAFTRLSVVCSYEPCRRVAGDLLRHALNDPDEAIQLSAGRAMLYAGGTDDVERVFEHAVRQNPLNRIVLSEELRRHAAVLCDRAIPKVLQSGDAARILGMLEMVAAWERALPMPGIGDLLHSENAGIRLMALQVAPLVQDAPEVRKGILDALADADTEIALGAARAAGRLRLEAALPALARTLRTGDPELARAAAAALADLPPRGWVALEEMTSSPNAATAAAAAEALSRVRGKQ